MKRNRHMLFLLPAVLVLLLSFVQPLSAEEHPIGMVVALRGNVIAVSTDGVKRALAVKSSLYRADTIKTGRRGRLQMMFDDNTLVSLGPNSDMQIEAYQWDSDKKTGEMKTRVNEGVFRIMGGAITQSAPQNFNTETPAGTIGIRGSMYAGKVRGSSLRLLFLGGKGVYVSNDAGTVNIDRPGFATFVAGPNTAPTKPARPSNEDMAQLDNAAADTSDDSDDEGEPDQATESQDTAGEDSEPEPATEPQEPAGEGSEPDQETESQEPGAEGGEPDPATEPQEPAADGNEPDPASGSQDPDVAGSEPLASQGEQPAQDTDIPEEFQDLAADEVTAPTGGAGTVSDFQASGNANPADTVKDTVSEVVVESIETVRQDEVLEIEKAILELLLQLGFSGSRLTAVNASGIEGYDGQVRHKLVDEQDYSQTPSKLVFNWHNKKFFGVVDDPDQSEEEFPVFIFGEVNGTALGNAWVIGSDSDSGANRVATINGTGTFGQLYGDPNEAVGFAAEGVDVNVQFQSDRQAWKAYGAAVRNNDPSSPAPTGSDIYRGYVMGYAEDMTAPDVNRRIFTNSAPDQFQLGVNKDTGTISGILSAVDDNGSSSAITNLQIGGSLPSAYVEDDAMIAFLGGANVITTGGSSGDLKQYGNYMVTRKKQGEIAPYTTWGYWEMAYQDPESGADYHLHGPGSYWIAGPQTPTTEVNNLMSARATGTYTGGAEGFQVDAAGRIQGLTGGATDLTIDFDPGAADKVTGRISFDQVNLNIAGASGYVNPDGFGAQISGATTSEVKGAFFGPDAAAVGGKFKANMSTGEGYFGIFSGHQ